MGKRLGQILITPFLLNDNFFFTEFYWRNVFMKFEFIFMSTADINCAD